MEIVNVNYGKNYCMRGIHVDHATLLVNGWQGTKEHAPKIEGLCNGHRTRQTIDNLIHKSIHNTVIWMAHHPLNRSGNACKSCNQGHNSQHFIHDKIRYTLLGYTHGYNKNVNTMANQWLCTLPDHEASWPDGHRSWTIKGRSERVQ